MYMEILVTYLFVDEGAESCLRLCHFVVYLLDRRPASLQHSVNISNEEVAEFFFFAACELVTFT